MKKKEILFIHGTDYKNMTKKLLERANLAGAIPHRDTKIALKPNLVAAQDASNGATTHWELAAGTIEYLKEHGFSSILIMESSWVGEKTDRSVRAAGYDKVCREYQVPFVDLQKDSYTECDARGMKLKVCDTALQAEFVINMPVLKGHCQTKITCALKNNKGVIPNSEKRRYHTMGLPKPIAHLNTVVRNDFILVDNICGDLDFEEGGNPVEMNRILGFWDPVLCDAFVCETMGYRPEEVSYLTLAEKLGVGSADLSQSRPVFVNQPEHTGQTISMTRRVEKLAGYARPKDACSACYGSLIYALDRLESRGCLKGKRPPVCIGQGYKGKTGEIGVGQCTSCFQKSLKGCPPKAVEILKFLEENWK